MKNIIIGIYKITSPSGCIYIGQAYDMDRRWNDHKRFAKKNRKSKLVSSFIKHGIENHKFEIIEICTEEQLNEREINYIRVYDTFETPHGLNLTSGGDSGRLSKETRKKISDHHKNDENYGMKGKTHSEETKEKQRKSKIGEKNHMFGKKQSLETIEKRRKTLKGKGLRTNHSEATRLKISEKLKEINKVRISPLIGRKQPKGQTDKMVATRMKNGSYKKTEEEKRKISLFQKGRKKSELTKLKMSLRLKGKKLSEQHKQALRDGHAKRNERIRQEKLTMIF